MKELVQALNEMRDAWVTLSLELGDCRFDEAMASKNNKKTENNGDKSVQCGQKSLAAFDRDAGNLNG